MRQKEKSILITTAALSMVLVVGLLFFVFGGSKSSSLVIDVKEEIPLPISIALEYGEKTLVLYESDTIASIEQEFSDYTSETEGVIWLTIGEKTYEILSYIDYADRPIVELTGDGTSLEVRAYTTLFQDTTLFQTSKDTYQSTTITLE